MNYDQTSLEHRHSANLETYSARHDLARMGADKTGRKDSSKFINDFLLDREYGFLSAGTYRVDHTIELKSLATLMLMQGVELVRMSEHSDSVEPILWQSGSGSTIRGFADASIIKTENKAPLGIVRIGPPDMTTTNGHGSTLYNTLTDVNIFGTGESTVAGADPLDSTEFDPESSAVYLAGPEETGQNYFNTIKNIRTSIVHSGVKFEGAANANFVRGILGVRNLAMIHLKGGIENIISDGFHHRSTDGTTLFLEDSDNTAEPNGNFISPSLNRVNNFIGEPGVGSRPIDTSGTTGGGGNVFRISHNHNLGPLHSDDWLKTNYYEHHRSFVQTTKEVTDDFDAKSNYIYPVDVSAKGATSTTVATVAGGSLPRDVGVYDKTGACTATRVIESQPLLIEGIPNSVERITQPFDAFTLRWRDDVYGYERVRAAKV